MARDSCYSKTALMLIPKYEIYIDYILNLLDKLPRIEKFNIGNSFKIKVYETMENIMYVNKVDKKYRMYYCNLIDAQIAIQRAYVRIMYKRKYIDLRKYNYCIDMLSQIGKLLGGYIKSLGVDYAKKD